MALSEAEKAYRKRTENLKRLQKMLKIAEKAADDASKLFK